MIPYSCGTIYVRLKNLCISPKNQISIYGWIYLWHSFLISTWDLGKTFRITMFLKHNEEKRSLVSLRNEKCSSPLRAWKIWRWELLSADLKSNHVPFALLKFFVSIHMYYLYILMQKWITYYIEVRVSFMLYIYFWHRWLLLLASVTVSPPDPNRFSQATLTSMVKTVYYYSVQ